MRKAVQREQINDGLKEGFDCGLADKGLRGGQRLIWRAIWMAVWRALQKRIPVIKMEIYLNTVLAVEKSEFHDSVQV